MNEKNLDKTIEMLEVYWSEIPIGKQNAASYLELMAKWGYFDTATDAKSHARQVRKILHDLSVFDNGDDYILIRSSKNGGGFYRTDNLDEIKSYRIECLNRGRNTFAPLKKINRVMKNNTEQYSITNNLRVYRESLGYLQGTVVALMKEVDESFDVPMLSKMENDVCLPTMRQCQQLAKIYRCQPSDLIHYEMFE